VSEATQEPAAYPALSGSSVGKGLRCWSLSDSSPLLALYDKAAHWLQSADKLAGREPQEGSLWHAYRRLWASAPKDLPDVDVAQAGGWSSLEALKSAYQQPDARTMLKVVTHQAELREAK